MTKKQKAQLLSALLLSSNLLCPSITQADVLYDGGTYNEDITLTEEMMVGWSGESTVNINGNLKITASTALAVHGTDDKKGILKINMNKNKTVQLEGNIVGSSGYGEVYVNFANSDSYLAGLVDGGA